LGVLKDRPGGERKCTFRIRENTGRGNVWTELVNFKSLERKKWRRIAVGGNNLLKREREVRVGEGGKRENWVEA